MKKFKIIFTLALVFVLAGIFAACELDTDPRAIVSFEDPRYGNNIPPVYVAKGKGMGSQMPSLPSPEPGVALYGWFDGTTQYYRDTIVSNDIKLTARWSDDVVTVKFVFEQKDNSGKVITPVAKVPDEIKGIRGIPLSPLSYPVTPRAQGWQFDDWLLNGERFNSESIVPGDITLVGNWVAKQQFTVTFEPGPGVTPIPPMKVYENECIDEWTPPGQPSKFPPDPTVNPVNTAAFFVSWLDDEFRQYNGRTPITRTLTIKGKWGLPPHIVNLRMADDDGEIEEIVSAEMGVQGSNDYGPEPPDGKGYKPVVRQAWDSTTANPKWVIVNETTYNVPYNPNRWRILYRIKFKWPANFDTAFYTKYTIRARFYANRQALKTWLTDPDYKEGSFQPDVPVDVAGYSEKGWLKKKGYDDFDADGKRVEISRSNDGWGQISWVMVANWNGGGNDAETLLQRYNIDRKGGTIGDDWAPLRGTDAQKGKPAYLLVQTSDNYIGHIEITDIIFYNGVVSDDPKLDEWQHGAYLGEEKPKAGAE